MHILDDSLKMTLYARLKDLRRRRLVLNYADKLDQGELDFGRKLV